MPVRSVAGRDTYSVSFGNGPRKALLMHCSLGHSDAYGRLCAHLGGALSTTAFDMPGHGRSADWDGASDFQDQVTEIALEFLDEPMDLIGHSFGGTVALRLAVTHPEKVRSVTVIEPPMMAVAKADVPGSDDAIREGMREFNAALDRGDRETAARVFTSQYGDGRGWDVLSEVTRSAIVERIHLIRAGTPAVEHDVNGLLEPGGLDSIAAPALVIDSGNTSAMMSLVMKGIAARIPDAELVQIKQRGGGHMLPLTHPEPVAAEILRLVSRAPK